MWLSALGVRESCIVEEDRMDVAVTPVRDSDIPCQIFLAVFWFLNEQNLVGCYS